MKSGASDSACGRVCVQGRGVAAMLLAMVSCAAWSATGLSTTGYGAESVGWGGVDLAIADDYTALNTNPAGLAQLQTQSLDVYLTPFYALNRHEDAYNGEHQVNNKLGGVMGFGYVRPFHGGDIVAGIGAFVQGGVGYVYKDLLTRYGNRDDLSSLFGVYKLAPGVAWRVNDRLRVGAALGFSYGTARQKLFPETSVAPGTDAQNPSAPFFGTRFDGGKAFGVNGKIGVQYEASDALTLAAAYTSKAPLDLKHATLTVNYESIGMGRVRYNDASQVGLAFGQEAGVGFVYRVNGKLRIGGEFNWVDQSGAMRSATLTARDPDGPAPADEIVAVQPLNWRDQYVFGIGGDYRPDPLTTVRAGWSHTGNPIPEQTLNPLLALVNEDDVALGFSRRLGEQWAFAGTAEYQFASKQPADNPGLPFGPGFDTNGGIVLTVMMSRRW